MTQYLNQAKLLTADQLMIATRISDAISDYDITHPDQLKRAAQAAERHWWNAGIDAKKVAKSKRRGK